ncbi:MAG: thiol peroxidase [Planctomycetales bacterium]
MADTRQGAVTLKGNPVNLAGNELKAGDAAPDFKLQDLTLGEVTLQNSAGKVRIIATIPSVDTSVCHAETKKFSDLAKTLSNVDVLVVSMDLPFGIKRWCGAEGVNNINTYSSAHRCTKFGEEDYGVLISGGPLDRCLARAIFVVGADGKLKHVEYVKEISEHPNYDAALAAARWYDVIPTEIPTRRLGAWPLPPAFRFQGTTSPSADCLQRPSPQREKVAAANGRGTTQASLSSMLPSSHLFSLAVPMAG